MTEGTGRGSHVIPSEAHPEVMKDEISSEPMYSTLLVPLFVPASFRVL